MFNEPVLQNVIFFDVKFHGTVIVLMVEDYLIDQYCQENETFPPVHDFQALLN